MMTARRRTLIVSDDPELLSSLTRTLEAMGFEVETALDYNEAVDHIVQRRLRLVCVDLNLPRDGGFDVCELVRSDPALGGVQILVMSEHDTPQEMADAEEAGANAFVRKPFASELIQQYVRAMLEGRKSSRPTIRELRPSDYPPPSSGGSS